MTAFRYLLNSTWKTFTNNRIMNLVSVGSIALALMVVGGLLLLQQNTSRLMNQLKTRTTMVVYLTESLSKTDRQNLESRLVSHSSIRDVTYRSKEDALSIMEQRLGEDAVDGLSSNPFPRSFHLSLEPEVLSSIEELAARVSDWEGIDEVDYGKEHVDRLQNLSQIVEVLIGSIGLIICVVAIFVIFNTIQLSVMSREDEIDILKLVGATRWFIGFPFILGGALQGIVGFLAGSGILWFLYWIVETRIRALEFFPVDPAFLTLWRASLLLGLGFVIGVIGSASAVSRAIRRM